MEIKVVNANQALAAVLYSLKENHVVAQTRNGEVWSFPEPITVTYTRPQQRVIFSPLRDANPFFHLLGDGLWCLAARNDIAWPTYFNKNFAEFTDDGVKHPGAYGHRWRHYFGRDQLKDVVQELTERPNSRRAVITMWDGGAAERLGDLARCLKGTKDACCNTQVYVDLQGGALNITVTNRSNDIWFGMLGANVVQFSLLQEFLATWLGVPIGRYSQISNNAHIYTNIVVPAQLLVLAHDSENHDHYPMLHFPLVNVGITAWEADLQKFMSRSSETTYADEFFFAVAEPMYQAWKERKEKRGSGMAWAEQIAAPDWRRACTEWIERRNLARAGR